MVSGATFQICVRRAFVQKQLLAVPVSVCSHAEAQTHVIMTVSAQGAAIDLLLELAHAGALKSKVSKSGPTLTDIKKIDSTESRGRVGVMT